MAHKKGVGSSKNGRESESKRLGIKIFGGQAAIAGNIIVRQRGRLASELGFEGLEYVNQLYPDVMDSEDKSAAIAAFVEKNKNKPFKWGEHDCALFTAKWEKILINKSNLKLIWVGC